MKRSMTGLVFCLLLWGMAGPVHGDQKTYLFEQGNELYKKGQYEKAAKAYEEILQMGYASADLYYNLGNAYYKLGEYPKAILNYERALRLRPRDEDIQFNLKMARLTVVDKIPELPELFYVRYFRSFRDLFSVRTLTVLVLAVYFLLAGVIILWILGRKPPLRRLAKTLFAVLLVVCLAFSFTLVSKIRYLNRNVEAIVMAPEVQVLSAPGEGGTEIFTIHQGLKVRIIEQSGPWFEIRLADGKTGWLKKSVLETI